MNYSTKETISTKDSLVIALFEKQAAADLTDLNQGQQRSLEAILTLGDFEAKVGQTSVQYLLHDFGCQRVILLGLGKRETYSGAAMRKALLSLSHVIVDSRAKEIQLILPKPLKMSEVEMLRQAVICLEDANVQRDQLKTKPALKHWPERFSFVGSYSDKDAILKQGQAVAAGIKLAKKVANLPANHCTPKILADYALELEKDEPSLSVEVYDEKAIRDFKMGCLLGVAQGSEQPPRMIVMNYKGGAAADAPIVFVGKGVTFDSGGISLKPNARMDEMKYDMCGAATVIAALKTAASLKLPLNLVGIAVCAENMPSGAALKPGDVLTSMSGKTVEVMNTDAEGRLILSDALCFAERFHPQAVIDVATLTGAIIVTFGSELSGLMSNNDALAQELLAAGEASGDRAWQLPIFEEYQALTDSAFADMANLGTDEAKSITAACFLSRFAEKYPWAHLDIAGVAWQGGGNMRRAATGRPLTLLMQYLFQKTDNKTER